MHLECRSEYLDFNLSFARIIGLSNLLELMPSLGSMCAGLALSNSHSLSIFLRLQLVSECPNFYGPFRNRASQACRPVRHGASVVRSLPAQQRRKADKMLTGLVFCHTSRNFEPWQSQSLLKPLVTSRLDGTGIASVRNQAQEDACTSSSDSYQTLAQPCTLTLEVKKSRFIAAATSVDDEAAALSFLSQVCMRRILIKSSISLRCSSS